ncbi:hypothetical protein CRYPA_667 [uncultured Candidatus Thioglobus sp.]|nr:hypothetical protein CRYPA_667 [uncultured Candidatus Thioglobus sp.]
MLLVVRLAWKVTNEKPSPLSTHKLWERKLASIVHIATYVLTIILCVTGYAMVVAEGQGAVFF